MEVLQLFETTYEGKDGNDVETTVKLGTFITNSESTAYMKVNKFLQKIGPVVIHLASNNEVYPKLFVKQVNVS